MNKGKGREYINTRQTSEAAGGDAAAHAALQKVGRCDSQLERFWRFRIRC